MKRLMLLGAAFALLAVPVHAQQPRKVTLVMSHPNIAIGEELFAYAVPQALGYFEKEGLQVELVGSAGSAQALQLVQSGSADFAMVTADSVMAAREQDVPVKAYFAVRHRPSYAIAVLPDSPIKTLEDLKGKKIGVTTTGSGPSPILRKTFGDIGFAAEDYTLIATGSGGSAAAALTSGNVDALSLWDSIYSAYENSGIALRYIEIPMTYKMPSTSLVTKEAVLKDDAALAAAMCRAIAVGTHFTTANPEESLRAYHKVFPQTVPQGMPEETLMKNDMNTLKAYLTGAILKKMPEGEDYGVSDADKWAFSASFAKELGVLKSDGASAGAFTNDFIKQCNDFNRSEVEAAEIN